MTIKKEDLELIVSGAAGGGSPPRAAVGPGRCAGGVPAAVSPRSLAVSPQMTEMEISRAAAERSLREHMGNVVEALIALTN